jgi:hypothetical protein
MDIKQIIKELEYEMDAWNPTGWLEAKVKGLVRNLLEELKKPEKEEEPLHIDWL